MSFKFSKQQEFTKLKGFIKSNPFIGNYTFATQTTCIYDSFGLVFKENEIMKIKTMCDKMFYNRNKIGILKDGKMKVYKDNRLINTFELPDSQNIRDFCMDDIRFDKTLFMIGDIKMTVTPTEVTLDDNTFINCIHVNDCTYFAGYYENIAILGNSKSLDFMYFLDGKPAEIDEFKPLCIRFDEETFEEILLKDIKFFGSVLLLIDPEMVTYFTLEDLPVHKPEMLIKEYEIKDDHIEFIDKEEIVLPSDKDFEKNKLSSDKDFEKNKLPSDKDLEKNKLPSDKDLEKNKLPSDKDFEKIDSNSSDKTSIRIEPDNLQDLNSETLSSDLIKKDISNEPMNVTRNDNTEIATKILNQPVLKNDSEINLKNDSEINLKNDSEINLKNDSEMTSQSLFKFNKSEVNKKNDFSPKKEIESSFSGFNSSFLNSFGIESKHKLNQNPDFYNAPIKPVLTSEQIEKEKIKSQFVKFDEDTKNRISKLVESFKNIKLKSIDLPTLEITASNFDINGLYNLIFSNQLDIYEEALSSMILRAEHIKSTKIENIKESIKFFDSKVFEKRIYKRPVRYTDPLCTRFNYIIQPSNPIDDILQGIKILEIKDLQPNITFPPVKNNDSSSSPVKNNDSSSSPVKNNDSSSIGMKEPSKPSNVPATSDIKQDQILPPNVNFTKPIPAALEQSNPSIFKPEIINPPIVQSGIMPPVNVDHQFISQPPSIPQTVLKPFGFNSLPTNQVSQNLFGNNPNLSNSFVVPDTSSLFNNLASNPTSNNINPHLNPNNGPINPHLNPNNGPNPQNPNEGPPTGSAFNRLSGSRRLFQ